LAGEKPTAAFVLSLIGGIFILLDGILLAVVGSAIAIGGLAGSGTAGGIVSAIGAIGVIFGLIIIIGGVMMYQKPQSHTMWGVIVLILSLISIITGGGFIIGLILGLIGGLLLWSLSLPWVPLRFQVRLWGRCLWGGWAGWVAMGV